MPPLPQSVTDFLGGRRFAVTGVSRDGNLPANSILRKLRAAGFEAVAVNPNAPEIAGEPCYPDLASIPGEIHGVVIASHPRVGVGIVRQAAARGIRQVWFHRSFGEGSVSPEALAECERLGLRPIVGGCPLMYCEPVDVGHRCFRWWLGWRRRVPV